LEGGAAIALFVAMRWPKHPVDSVHPSRFHPPFCPWPLCRAHLGRGKGFHRHGFYRTQRDCRRIPRFLCLDCGRTCGRKTFSTEYYLKRPDLLVTVAAGLTACSAHRQIARSAHCAKTSVTRMAERLGRHAVLFHRRCLESLPGIAEAVVHDHFETFIRRQDHALGVGTAVGSKSWFVYDVDPAPHRGSGRRPDRQAAALLVPSRTYVASIRRSFSALLPKVHAPDKLCGIVDGRVDYRAAVIGQALRERVALRVYPNPKRGPTGTPRSAEAIERDHAMFPVDQLHQLIRHTCADHKRETLAFGRRLESILGRAHLVAVWKNFIKSRSERKLIRRTPAMWLGMTDESWRWERVLSRRLFVSRIELPISARKLYEKRWTPRMPALDRKHAA
jgi:transposase-like protein